MVDGETSCGACCLISAIGLLLDAALAWGVQALWGVLIPIMFPGAVATGTVAATIPYWVAFVLVMVFGFIGFCIACKGRD